MSITWPCFGTGALSITISLPLLLIQHAKHANAILVFVILRVELFGCEPVDQADAQPNSFSESFTFSPFGI
jgi:hypothetical protein